MESLWKPVIKRLDQRLCDFKLPRNLPSKNSFSLSVVLRVFVCLCVFVAPFFCGGFLKISSLCHLSWLASVFSNCRKYIAKYSDSSSDAKCFFFPRNKTNRHSRLSKFSINLKPPLSIVIFPL